MSPVSRGRKGKKKGQGRESAPAEAAVPSDEQPDSDAAELEGLAEMMDEVVARIDEFEQVDEPVDGEYLAAGLLAVGYGESAEYRDAFARLFVDKALELATPGAVAFLRCLAGLTQDPAREMANEAAGQLVAGGVVAPEWVGELDEPVSAGEFVRWADTEGAGATLFGSFGRAGRTDGFLIFVDDDNCGAAYDLAPFVGEGLTQARELTDEQEPAEAQLVDATDFRWQVQAALDARMLHDHAAREFGVELEEPEEEDSIPHEVVEVVARARLEALPAPTKPLPVHVHPEFELGLA